MILKHDDLRNTVEFRFVGIDTIFQYHAKSVSGIDVLDPQGIRKEPFANRFAILRTGHPIHEQCMRVNHKLGFKNVVQWRFHGWAAGIIENGFAHKVFNQFLTGMRFFGRFHIIKPVDLGPVESDESFLLQAGESGAGWFYPKGGFIFVGSVTSSALNIFRRSKFVREFDDGL